MLNTGQLRRTPLKFKPETVSPVCQPLYMCALLCGTVRCWQRCNLRQGHSTGCPTLQTTANFILNYVELGISRCSEVSTLETEQKTSIKFQLDFEAKRHDCVRPSCSVWGRRVLIAWKTSLRFFRLKFHHLWVGLKGEFFKIEIFTSSIIDVSLTYMICQDIKSQK